jgi:hypothetical protein
LKLLKKHSLHVGFLQQFVDTHHVLDVPLVHHPHQAAFGTFQQGLSPFHDQGLQHVPDDCLLDRRVAVEMISSSFFLLDIVPGLLEVLGHRELHHANHLIVVLILEILDQAGDEVALEVTCFVGIFRRLDIVLLLFRAVLKSIILRLDHFH